LRKVSTLTYTDNRFFLLVNYNDNKHTANNAQRKPLIMELKADIP